ncbi:hypothetical protein E2C01_000461 [Portunus trituberculatus]|uniref:Uncharacterized protein n=1 Tax=Portunus trituberculatus TaxID=210409 RepID=A0A5B7CGN3_PORTR|nr:hypothetical protein [Portunus trituberculatus]
MTSTTIKPDHCRRSRGKAPPPALTWPSMTTLPCVSAMPSTVQKLLYSHCYLSPLPPTCLHCLTSVFSMWRPPSMMRLVFLATCSGPFSTANIPSLLIFG